MTTKKACLVLGALLMGCSSSNTPTDSGILVPDAGPVPAGSCALPHELPGILGTTSIMLDTTGGAPGALDLGTCGNPMATTIAPQAVVAYTVPGTGTHAVEFTTAVAGTITNFDTLVQVRTDCAVAPADGFPMTCFDDMSRTDPRAAGVVSANGGDVIYFVVTGFSETTLADAVERGPVQLQVTARPNDIPTASGGDVRLVGDRTQIELMGTDADGDAIGMAATFLTAAGAAVDVDSDGDTSDALLMLFDTPPSAPGAFTGVTNVSMIRVGPRSVAALSDQLRTLGATQATLAPFDEAFALGGAVTVPIRDLAEVGLGASCGVDAGCTVGLECTRGACVAIPAVAAACAAATGVVLVAPTGAATTRVSQTGSFGPGNGTFEGSCGHTPGTDAEFDVTVPAGAFDLILTTDMPGTMMTDTILYVRSVCADRLTETYCNDNIGLAGNSRSRIEVLDVAAGNYAVFVEPMGHVRTPMPAPFELELALRPVLGAGAACDATGTDNRCSTGTCASATSLCP